jgi:hypothetical protein
MSEFRSHATAADQRRIFLRGYFARPVLKYQRILLGPVLLVLAAVSFFHHSVWYYSLFFLFLAVYYAARPFLTLFQGHLGDSDCSIAVENGILSIRNESGVTEFRPENLLRFYPHPRYPMLKLHLGSVNYLMFDLTLFDDGPGFAQALSELPMVEKPKNRSV